MDISTYKPVSKSAKCNRCSSQTVTWWEDPNTTKNEKGHFRLCEIFMLDAEEVFSTEDTHNRYCTNPLFRPKGETDPDPFVRKRKRQAEISTTPIPDPEPTPEPVEPSPIPPIVNGRVKEREISTNPFDYTEPGEGVGHLLAMKVKFVAISERIAMIRDNPRPGGELDELAINELKTLYHRLAHEYPS